MVLNLRLKNRLQVITVGMSCLGDSLSVVWLNQISWYFSSCTLVVIWMLSHGPAVIFFFCYSITVDKMQPAAKYCSQTQLLCLVAFTALALLSAVIHTRSSSCTRQLANTWSCPRATCVHFKKQDLKLFLKDMNLENNNNKSSGMTRSGRDHFIPHSGFSLFYFICDYTGNLQRTEQWPCLSARFNVIAL